MSSVLVQLKKGFSFFSQDFFLKVILLINLHRLSPSKIYDRVNWNLFIFKFLFVMISRIMEFQVV